MVPKIRFKDEQGNDYPEWKRVFFCELYDFKSTNSFPREKLNYAKGHVRNIHYGDIHTKYKSRFKLDEECVPYLNSEVVISRIPDDSYCREGDLVIADASEDYSEIGKTIELIALNGQRVLAGLHTLHARRKFNEVWTGFGAYMMSSDRIKIQVRRIAQGTKVLGITANRMKKIVVHLPIEIEQQKIADFLSSVDTRIEHLEKKRSLLEQYKKGMMQKLFSRKIRFKDERGNEYPQWRETKLDKLTEVIRGVTFDKSEAFDSPSTGRLPVLRAGNIGNQLDLHRDLVWLPKETISQTQRLKKRDIVMCASSGSNSIVGKCAAVRNYWKGTVGAFCFIIRANSRKINSDYLTYFLKSEEFSRWTRSAEGTNIKNIRLGDLRKYPIPFPSFVEQQKIADFLLSIDRQIELTSEQIGETRAYKKGLLQQMFV